METAVYVLSCGALERSKNPCIESIVEACVSQNHKDILTMEVWLRRKSWKRAEAMEKNIHKLWAEFAYLCVWERKKINTSKLL